MTSELDIFLRGCAVGVLCLSATVFLTSGALNRKRFAVVSLCLGLCAYVIVSSQTIDLGNVLLEGTLVVIAGVVPVLLYWASIELFQDEVEFKTWQLVVGALIVGLAWLSQWQIQLGAVRGVCVLIFFIHLLKIIILGEPGDLIAARRQFRRWFLVWILSLGIIITGLEITHLDSGLPTGAYTFQAMVVFLSAGAFLVWSVRVAPDVWVMSPPRRETPTNPAQTALIKRIKAAMAEGLWRQEGLTVAEMSAHLQTQEHRMRSAINQAMGYRNFASFINAFRIAEAQKMLMSDEFADRTVLSIAYDVGFSSLGPFNRAFRAQTGTTPTEFRKANHREAQL